MLNFIKKIDKLFGGKFREYYYSLQRNISHLFYPGITPLGADVKKKFELFERYKFFQSAQYFLQVNRIDGVYLEFGSHELNTFRMALNTLGAPGKPNKIHKFISFDSFQGMPEPVGIDRQKIWKRSMNFTSLDDFYSILRKDLHRIEAVKGFYEESLTSYKFDKNFKIALAYIDCDYYSSTLEVLNFLKDKITHGTLIAFDDWHCYYSDPKRGQKLAYNKFKKEVEDLFEFVEFEKIASGGMSFVCLEKNKIGLEIL